MILSYLYTVSHVEDISSFYVCNVMHFYCCTVYKFVLMFVNAIAQKKYSTGSK